MCDSTQKNKSAEEIVDPRNVIQFGYTTADQQYFDQIAKEAVEYASKLNVSAANLQPVPATRHVHRSNMSNEALEAGWEAIHNSRLAVITLAGGQASRLGVDVPKGTVQLDLGFTKPVMNTLFYQQAAQLVNLINKGRSNGFPKCTIRWIIMTSSSTDVATRAFLKEVCQEAGYPFEEILFIVQRDLPIYLPDGSYLIDDRTLMTAPNGNGGLFEALENHLETLRSQGFFYYHVYCVDNILCYVADPLFIGTAIFMNADCACKCVEKVDPEEKIGVICMHDSNDNDTTQVLAYNEAKAPEFFNKEVCVVEYSEISAEQKAARNPTDASRLMFSAGNIANHFFTIDFLDVITAVKMPMHRAEKFVRHRKLDTQEYTKTLACKLERFVFDVFSAANNFLIFEVSRDEEFSPLKNSNDVKTDCADTCKKALVNRQAKWLERTGKRLEDLANNPLAANHISTTGIFSPLVAYFDDDLKNF